jgi:hypothetical protein
MALVERLINVTIGLAQGAGQPTTFSDGGGDTVTLKGLRTSAKIAKAGGPSDCTMDLTIYGMTRSQMNQLSTLGMQINLVPKNSVVVTAGDNGATPATVFVGYILSAYADFQAQPDVAFRIAAHSGLPQSVIPAEASSYKGAGDVVTIMSSLATKMGLSFENSGVTGKLSNPYFSGSLRDQAQACATAANISMIIDNGKLAIWPKNGSRGGQIPLVSPDTGMIGYPAYTAYGIMLMSLFNPSIGFGGKIKVQSELPAACGEWSVYGLDHDIESMMPGGKWQSTIMAYNPKYPTPVR